MARRRMTLIELRAAEFVGVACWRVLRLVMRRCRRATLESYRSIGLRPRCGWLVTDRWLWCRVWFDITDRGGLVEEEESCDVDRGLSLARQRLGAAVRLTTEREG